MRPSVCVCKLGTVRFMRPENDLWWWCGEGVGAPPRQGLNQCRWSTSQQQPLVTCYSLVLAVFVCVYVHVCMCDCMCVCMLWWVCWDEMRRGISSGVCKGGQVGSVSGVFSHDYECNVLYKRNSFILSVRKRNAITWCERWYDLAPPSCAVFSFGLLWGSRWVPLNLEISEIPSTSSVRVRQNRGTILFPFSSSTHHYPSTHTWQGWPEHDSQAPSSSSSFGNALGQKCFFFVPLN